MTEDARVSSPDLLVVLRGLRPTLPPSQLRVAEAILADPEQASSLTISQLAHEAATSETTVLRLCHQLGVTSYRDLRLTMAAESGRQRARGDTRDIDGVIGRDTDLESLLATVTTADQQAIAETARILDRTVLSESIERVARARRVDVFGVGASAFVAADLHQKLHRIGVVTFAWSDTHAALTSAALLGPADVAIGISHTGQTRDTAEVITEAARRGAHTIGVTSVGRSALALAADLVLVTAARETTFRSGATASRIAALSVVDVLFVGVAQRRYDQTLTSLDRTWRAVAPRRFPSRRGEKHGDTDSDSVG